MIGEDVTSRYWGHHVEYGPIRSAGKQLLEALGSTLIGVEVGPLLAGFGYMYLCDDMMSLTAQ